MCGRLTSSTVAPAASSARDRLADPRLDVGLHARRRSTRCGRPSRLPRSPTAASSSRAGSGAARRAPGPAPRWSRARRGRRPRGAAPRRRATSRANGPIWSSDAGERDDPVAADTRPYVGLSPTMPVSAAGWRIEPPVSVPSDSGAWIRRHRHRRAAADEPPGTRLEVPRVRDRARRRCARSTSPSRTRPCSSCRGSPPRRRAAAR